MSKYQKLPWILQVLWNPVEALDLLDPDGKPDHGKVLPAILLISAIIFQALGKQYALGITVVLGSLAYGQSAWRAFLKSKSVTVSDVEETDTKNENVKVDITEEITQRVIKNRNSEDGIDPTPD